jgi:hypothetical protein
VKADHSYEGLRVHRSRLKTVTLQSNPPRIFIDIPDHTIGVVPGQEYKLPILRFRRQKTQGLGQNQVTKEVYFHLTIIMSVRAYQLFFPTLVSFR